MWRDVTAVSTLVAGWVCVYIYMRDDLTFIVSVSLRKI